MERRNGVTRNTPRVGDRLACARSRITNGKELLPGIDERSVWVRRLRDVINLHAEDRGGDDSLSEAERSILRRAAVLTVELEYQEAKFAEAHAEGRMPSDKALDLYSRLAGNLRRLLESVGIRRSMRDVSPLRGGDLEGYLDE
jgi:hypothetical protein